MLPPVPSLEEGVVLMYVTYDNLFTFVLMIIAIITLVKSFYDKHKKKPSYPEKVNGYFLISFAGVGEVHSPSGCLVKYIIVNITASVNISSSHSKPPAPWINGRRI